MAEERDRHQVIWDYLHRLTSLQSVPAFSREFYGLIAKWAVHTDDAASIALAVRLFEVETRFYRQVEAQGPEQAVPASAMEKRRIALQVLYERAQARGQRVDPNAELVRRLIMAECAYYLERHEEVVAHLEYTLSHGGTDPLLHFALGHARFLLALHSFVRLELPGAELVVADRAALQSLCLAAVTAFEGALTGGPRDAEVLWWIGRVLMTAGLAEAADDVLAHVEAHEPEETTEGRERELTGRDAALRRLGPINQEELAEFIAAVRRPQPLYSLL